MPTKSKTTLASRAEVKTGGETVVRRPGRPPVAVTLRDAAKKINLYLDPRGVKEIKAYCVEKEIKVHTFLVEGIEAFCRNKGLRQPIRITTSSQDID